MNNKVKQYMYAALAALPNPNTGGLGTSNTPFTLGEVQGLIQQIADFLIIISMVIAVIMIVWGGIVWMTAHGGDRAKKGRAIIGQGIMGAAVVLAVGVILQTVAALVTRQFFK